MQRRRHETRPGWPFLRRLSAVLFFTSLACAGIDEDIEIVLDSLAGQDATDCGTANDTLAESRSPEDVRSCVIAALQAGAAFRASSWPMNYDSGGGDAVGWASDGENLWRLDYTYFGGCGWPEDDLNTQTCTDIVDAGPDCAGGVWETLCFTCSSPSAANADES